MNVDLTADSCPVAPALLAAVDRAGPDGTVTISAFSARWLAEELTRETHSFELSQLAADLLKGVVLQGAARAALPVTEDVRALVRLARELYSELAVPTPWPVVKPEPEDEE